MSILCTACGLEIPLGHDSIYMSHGSVQQSKKSGRAFHNSIEDNPIHSDIDCMLLYLSYRTNSSADQLTDSAIDKFRAKIEPDLRIEITDEVKENMREEIQDEVVDHLGKHCAVCNEEMENFHEALERDTDPPQYQRPPPLPLPFQ